MRRFLPNLDRKAVGLFVELSYLTQVATYHFAVKNRSRRVSFGQARDDARLRLFS